MSKDLLPTPPAKKSGFLRNQRRVSQLLFLGLWLFLFLGTGTDLREAMRADVFLLSDPLVAIGVQAASRTVVPALLVAALMLVLAFAFGRVFCGWVCPLGTLIDATGRLLRSPDRRFSDAAHRRVLRWKYWLLAFTLAAALGASEVFHLLDPLVVLFRGATAAWPAFQGVMPKAIVPSALRMQGGAVALGPVLLLLLILGLTALTRRFFCRYLCPLGALYGLLSRIPLLRRRVHACDGCHSQGTGKQCAERCRMQAVPSNPHRTRNDECIRCMEGHATCPRGSIGFAFPKFRPERNDRALDVGRRELLLAGLGGFAAAPFIKASEHYASDPNQVIRPPRVENEADFLAACARCGMCIQACPTRTLRFQGLASGLAGLWTPALTPRIAGCDVNCNACSLVCPTEAIPPFSARTSDKWATKMGTVVFEAGRCISHVDRQACARCLMICPTDAFIEDSSPGQVPRRPIGVEFARCVGCALCETACRKVVIGPPALTMVAWGRGQRSLLKKRTREPGSQ